MEMRSNAQTGGTGLPSLAFLSNSFLQDILLHLSPITLPFAQVRKKRYQDDNEAATRGGNLQRGDWFGV